MWRLTPDYLIFEITEKVCPAACASFRNHMLGSVGFSADEWSVIQKLLDIGSSNGDGSVSSPRVSQELEHRVRAVAEDRGFSSRQLDRLMEKLRTGRQQ